MTFLASDQEIEVTVTVFCPFLEVREPLCLHHAEIIVIYV